MVQFLLPFLFYSSAVIGVNGRQVKPAPAAICGFGGLPWRRSCVVELEGCSVSEEALSCLDGLGIIDEMRRGGNVKRVAPTVARKMNELYESNNFFSSHVAGYEVSPDGNKLTLKCVENGVPTSNFKFFVRDEEHGHEVDVSGMELVQSSSSEMPRGKFREESCRPLRNVLFADGDKLVQFDTAVFDSLKRSDVWSNLEYAIWRSKDGQYHLHCFCDGPGVTHRINYTLTNVLSKEGAQLRIGLCNLDLLGTKLLAELGADIGINEWYKMSPRHKVNLSLTFDSLRKGLWSDRVGNTMVMTLAANFSAEDFLRILRLRESKNGDKPPKALMSGSICVNSWPNRCKVTVAADSKTLHLKSFRQSFNNTYRKLAVSTQHSITIKAPIDALGDIVNGAHDKVYVRSHHALQTTIQDYDAAVGLRIGSNVDHSGFRGTMPKLCDFYLLLATDLTRSVTKRTPWLAIKPGVFLDVMCTLQRNNPDTLGHKFTYSAGVMVKVLGVGVSLALSEVPKNIPGGLIDLLASLKKSFYMMQAAS